MSESKIKYAYYSKTFDENAIGRNRLDANATRIKVDEYNHQIHEKSIYCPGCFTSLTRRPLEKDLMTNGRRASFSHRPKHKYIPCDLRTKITEGKKFLTEEEAKQAIQNQDLVIINSFMQAPPPALEEAGEYDQSQVEDVNGPNSELPLSRHTGDKFSLPTKISTVAALCRNFDENLYRYYSLPGKNSAFRLIDLLHDIRDIKDEADECKLYFGKIKSVGHGLKNPKSHNIRMTFLYHNADIVDFCIKTTVGFAESKGINSNMIDRYVLFWGKITPSGVGFCANNIQWGEINLLPRKYEELLPITN